MLRLFLSTIIVLITIIIFGGCAKSQLTYTMPENIENIKIQTTKEVIGDYNKIWSTLIRNLSDTSFSVNNIEKDSGFINISFSSNNPNEFIDCGKWSGFFENMQTKEIYNFDAADNANFLSLGDGVIRVNRVTELNGRINLSLQKIDNQKSMLKVNVRYVFTGKDYQTFLAYSYRNNISTWDITFDSKTIGKNKLGQTTCKSIGTLEKKLLSLVDEFN